MIELSKCNKLLDDGLSLITIGDNKVPNIKWKQYQEKQISKEEFENVFNLPTTKGVGIITGYEFLEVIDVDLKVLSTAKEQKDFWEEFISYLEDTILDFYDKFVVCKTKNKGYHILYKTKRVKGNQKLAKLKGHKEAIIETRGVGGYVFIYEDFLKGKYYTNIDFITDEDYFLLYDIIDSFDYKEVIQQEIKEVTKQKKEYKEGLTPWDDYNQKVSVLDVVSDEFRIVKQLSNKIVIKRDGATSAHSGYIYKDNGCMYLHSTGTIYPHEKQISAYVAYTYKNHNGDFSQSAKQLYKDGYGDRQSVQPPKIVKKELQEQKERVSKDINFPIDIFPKYFQRYILDCHETLDSSIDYMGCSLLWTISVIVGNTCEIEVKRNWREKPILWFALVGKAGIGKTPSISNIVRPLEKENKLEIKRFFNQLERWEEYNKLSAEQKKFAEVIKKPTKTQFIANDITVEALIQMHQESKNSVGIFKDELAGWFKDMNKYREGSDLEMWLSSWSGKAINLNRVNVSSNAFLPSPFMPVLGGIQPSILNNFFTAENKDNGFIDRVLLCYPELEVEKYNDKEMSYDIISWYENEIIKFYRLTKKSLVNLMDENDEIKPNLFRFSKDANKEWVRIFNKITNFQNSDETNEYLKSMLPKQKSYIPRFALLLEVFYMMFDQTRIDLEVKKDSVLGAEMLSDYFVKMAQKIKINAKEVSGLKKIVNNEKKNNLEKVEDMYNFDPDFNRSEAAELLGISRQMIYKYLKEIK